MSRSLIHFVQYEVSLTWSCGSRERDTTSSECNLQLNNLAVKELMLFLFFSVSDLFCFLDCLQSSFIIDDIILHYLRNQMIHLFGHMHFKYCARKYNYVKMMLTPPKHAGSLDGPRTINGNII